MKMRFFSSQTLANTNYYVQQSSQQNTISPLPPHQLRTFSPFQLKIPVPPPVQPQIGRAHV